MNSQFKTAYRTNLVFYVFEWIVLISVCAIYHIFPPHYFIATILFAFAAVVSLEKYASKPDIDIVRYGVYQIILFTVMNVFMAIFFDSAHIYVYGAAFSSILNFIFVNSKLAKIQLYWTFFTSIAAIFIVPGFTNDRKTHLVFIYGTVMLLVMNWIIVSMTNHITFQQRRSFEQERSLDDLLKVVEAKCDAARDAAQSKADFLANMSHEIRTPINAIMGMNEMILRESSNPEVRNYATEAKNAATSLLGIINDVLDISKIEAGKFTIVPVEYRLSQVVIDTYNLVKFKSEAKNLSFDVFFDEELPSVFIGDDVRLKQVLSNLLSNAVKYTHKGGFTLEVKYMGGGEIYFCVRDTGIGIREENISALFDSFARLEEKRNRYIEGTGLGLSITQAILKAVGSKLEVESIYGVGSEFSFVLKQEVVDETPSGKINLKPVASDYKPYKAGFSAENCKVLVVDDNDVNRMVFVSLLKPTKIKIDEASSGKECLELVRKTAYDIIFMDHMMPEMDGVETFKAMREDKKNLSWTAPVIALTANAIAGAKEYYLSEGFHSFMSKPIDPGELEKLVFNLLSDNRAEITIGEAEEEPVSEAPEKELPIISGLDWSYAKLHLKEQSSLLATIKMFRTAMKKDAEILGGFYSELDSEEGLDQYRVKVHSMKSSAGLIGIVQLAGMAMELEAAAKKKDRDTIQMMHYIFIDRWLSFYEPLGELFEDENPLKQAENYTNEIVDILGHIRRGAEEMDVGVLDDMSKKLEEYSFSDETAEKIEEIRTMIFNFEVEKLMVYDYDSVV
ncbi:MAG: response regulator [Ruminiclostridium sp.]|nr:response regulator [Ruminiclostridium sp.]